MGRIGSPIFGYLRYNTTLFSHMRLCWSVAGRKLCWQVVAQKRDQRVVVSRGIGLSLGRRS